MINPGLASGVKIAERVPTTRRAAPERAARHALDSENADDDTSDGRIARWQTKLLDLTLRNRLLNWTILALLISYVPLAAAVEPLRIANRMSERDLYKWSIHRNMTSRYPESSFYLFSWDIQQFCQFI